MSKHRLALVSLAAAVALAGGVLARTTRQAQVPKTLADAARIAEGLGLYHASDLADGRPSSRLLLSDTPLTWERAGAAFLSPGHPCLAGLVAVYDKDAYRFAECNYNPTCSAIWGGLFVFGDPRLIERLTGAPPADADTSGQSPGADSSTPMAGSVK